MRFVVVVVVVLFSFRDTTEHGKTADQDCVSYPFEPREHTSNQRNLVSSVVNQSMADAVINVMRNRPSQQRTSNNCQVENV